VPLQPFGTRRFSCNPFPSTTHRRRAVLETLVPDRRTPTSPTSPTSPPDSQTLARARDCYPQVDNNLILGRFGSCCEPSPPIHTSLHLCFPSTPACQRQARRQREKRALCIDRQRDTVPRSPQSYEAASHLESSCQLVRPELTTSISSCEGFLCPFETTLPNVSTSSARCCLGLNNHRRRCRRLNSQAWPDLLAPCSLYCFGIMTSPASLSQPIQLV
jgi:hypothetical protein